MTRRNQRIFAASTPIGAVDGSTAGPAGGGFVNNGEEPNATNPSVTNILQDATANRITAIQFTLRKTTIVARGTIVVGTLSAGGFAYAGIYSANATTGLPGSLLLQCKFSTAAVATVVATITGGGFVILPPGVYWYAAGADNAVAHYTVLSYDASIPVNQNFTRFGHAANPIAGGSMPATLGVITASIGSVMATIFES